MKKTPGIRRSTLVLLAFLLVATACQQSHNDLTLRPEGLDGAGASIAAADPDVCIDYSTYLGGGAEDEALAIDVDEAMREAYVSGFTRSSVLGSGLAHFPVTPGAFMGAYDAHNDAYVTRLSADGSTILASSLIHELMPSSQNHQEGESVVVVPGGDAYVVGSNGAGIFPTTPGVIREVSQALTEGWVARLSSDGMNLDPSTMLGSGDPDRWRTNPWDVWVDSHGFVYVVGGTEQNGITPTEGAFQASPNGGSTPVAGTRLDGFVMKLNSDLTAVEWATYLGGSQHDEAQSVWVDAAGTVYVAGYTESPDFPTTVGSFSGGRDAFVAALDASGKSLAFSTVIGGASDETAYGVVGDGQSIFVVGDTRSPGLATGALLSSALSGPSDSFVAELDLSGGVDAFGYLGGSGSESAEGLDIDIARGWLLVGGATDSSDFSTASPVQASLAGGSDAFVALIDWDLGKIRFSSFLGGPADDSGVSVVADGANGEYYIAGSTASDPFPTTVGAVAEQRSGGVDSFVTRLSLDCGFEPSPIGSFKCPSVFFANAYPNNTSSYSTLTRLDPDTQAVVTGWLDLGMAGGDPNFLSDEDWNAIGIRPSGSMNVLMYSVRAYDSNATPPALPEIYSITPAPEPNVTFLGQVLDPGSLTTTGTNNQNGVNGTVTHRDQGLGANARNGRYFAGTFAWVNNQWEYVLLRSRSNQDVHPSQGTFTTFSQQTHMITIDVQDPNGPTVTGVIVLPQRWQVPGTSIWEGVDTGDIAADSMNPTLMYGLGFVGDIDGQAGDDPGTILRFDLDGNVVPVTTTWAPGQAGATLAGSAFFDLQGDFWIVTRTGTQLDAQDLLIEFNVVRDSDGAIVQATEARRVQFTPALSGGTDGASCPFTEFDWGTSSTPSGGDFYEIAERRYCARNAGTSVASTNLYQQPDSTSSVTGAADSTSTVVTTGRAFRSSSNEIWFEVRSGGTTGWILAQHLAEGECSTTQSEGEYREIERSRWCADRGVEMRGAPDATANPIVSVAGTISNTGLGYVDGNGVSWIEVTVGQETGWVRASQLAEGPCEEPTTTTTIETTGEVGRETEVCESFEGDLTGEDLEIAVAFLHGAGFNVILGTDEPDSLVGSEGADAIFGRGGDDEIDGSGGNDCVFGGPGDDAIRTRGGDDFVAAGSGDDRVDAGDGLDTVLGEAGNDDLDSGLPSGFFEDGGPGVDTCALLGSGITNGCEQ